MAADRILGLFSKSFLVLKNRVFAVLYFAESVSLLGDAFTWVGLALLSYQFGREKSAIILATALTLRVTAFIIFSPFAGVLADRMSRKTILYTTHFTRMAIVACLPFVNQEWQIYALVFLLNVFNALRRLTGRLFHRWWIIQIIARRWAYPQQLFKFQVS
ncbi:hypothetical protein [Mucilaginibacter sp.]|uniref:hypothetical protein n=1 Tax=Mucilaginibacter sp. TaxID=1882438 RepID=UPI00374D2D2F